MLRGGDLQELRAEGGLPNLPRAEGEGLETQECVNLRVWLPTTQQTVSISRQDSTAGLKGDV